jgi:hypothetical protein
MAANSKFVLCWNAHSCMERNAILLILPFQFEFADGDRIAFLYASLA